MTDNANNSISDPSKTSTTRDLTGEKFAEGIRQRQLEDWSDRRISGKVDLTGVTVEDPLIIRDTVFTDEVNFSQARFKRGVDLVGCRFEQKLICSDVHVEGPLRLDNVVIGKEKQPFRETAMLRQKIARLKEGWSRARLLRMAPGDRPPPERARLKLSLVASQKLLKEAEAKVTELKTLAEFDGLRVEGSLSMTRIQVAGHFSCNHAEVQNDLRMDGALICGSLWLRHAKLGELRNDLNKFVDSVTKSEVALEPQLCWIGGDLELSSSAISGDVFLLGINVSGLINLQAADVNGNFVCRSGDRQRTRLGGGAWLLAARVKGNIDFSGVRLHGDLTLAVANVGGSLQCYPAGEGQAPERRPGKWCFMMDGIVHIENVRAAADMEWFKCHVRGDFFGAGAKIENNVSFALSHIDNDLSIPNASIRGDLNFSGASIEGTLQLQNVSVGGTLFLGPLTWSQENVRCQVGKTAWLLGIKVTGNIQLNGIRIGDDLILLNATVGQDLLAKPEAGFQTEIQGVAYLDRIQIRGDALFAGVILHKGLNMRGVAIAGDFALGLGLADTPDWKVVRSSLAKGVDAESATFSKRVMLSGVTANSPDGATRALVNFAGAQINGEFSLYSPEYIEWLLKTRKAEFLGRELTEEIENDLRNIARRELTSISGDLRLTRVQVLGGVVLDGASIHGELDLRDATVKAALNCRPINVDGQLKRVAAQRADFEALDMTGDVDLTGLDITGKGEGEQKKDGDLILRDAHIRGRLELSRYHEAADSFDANQRSEPEASICGDLRLDAAEISHIILSGNTFKDTDHARDPGPGWFRRNVKLMVRGGQEETKHEPIRFALERGRIGRLQIVKPLPGTLDLSNLRVDRWDLPENPTVYQELLEHSYPFKRSNYLAIENTLRNEGLDKRADEVNVSMRRRDRRTTKNLAKIWLDSFLDVSIKYGTVSWRLACVMVLLFVLALWIFANPSHVEYSISPASQKPPPVEHPAPTTWGLRESALFAARMNVPIVSLGIDEKIQPSGFGLKLFAIGVTAASWVMWPLLIASMSGFIRKKK